MDPCLDSSKGLRWRTSPLLLGRVEACALFLDRREDLRGNQGLLGLGWWSPHFHPAPLYSAWARLFSSQSTPAELEFSTEAGIEQGRLEPPELSNIGHARPRNPGLTARPFVLAPILFNAGLIEGLDELSDRENGMAAFVLPESCHE